MTHFGEHIHIAVHGAIDAEVIGVVTRRRSPDTYRTDDLHDAAEQLRKAIAAIDYPVTASIGIATAPLATSFDPTERELIDDLVNLADTAMYAAKHAGGNQSRSTHIPHADLKGSPD